MDDITREPKQIRAEDINPRHNWGRALPALGIMGVDFEERVDYRRLHRYRLSRARQALENTDVGALLGIDKTFDAHECRIRPRELRRCEQALQAERVQERPADHRHANAGRTDVSPAQIPTQHPILCARLLFLGSHDDAHDLRELADGLGQGLIGFS